MSPSPRDVSVIEYGLLASLIALAIIAAVTALGTNIRTSSELASNTACEFNLSTSCTWLAS